MVATDLTKRDGSGAVTVGLLDASGGGGGLASGLGGELLAGGFASGRLAGGLLGNQVGKGTGKTPLPTPSMIISA